ncbi:hypothetical protein RhiirA5_385936 [Rhizophagus irregularis]|uniref:Uncharacterized protein n=1 Tax=Rhizophagus irregularis TaxID=588596 RepID=A0A2N0NLV1_9GLOM|nr:hypothetical protein RhiirA5_385936 [Rhizophagus irregularis]
MGLLMYQTMEEIAFPSVQEFKAFNPSKLCLFLKNKFKDEIETFHYFEILEQEKVSGKSFMLLTREHIQGPPYDFPLGSILLIEELIRKLKSQEEKFIKWLPNFHVRYNGITKKSNNCKRYRIVRRGGIETSMEKMNITENLAHSKLNDNGLLRRLFKCIAEAHEFSYKAIADDIRSTNHSISETTVGKFYRGESELTPGNKLAVQKWVGKFIDEWKRDNQSVTILVKLDTTKSTK